MPRKPGVSAAGDDNLKKRWNFSLSELAREGINRLFKFWGYKDASTLLEALGRGEIFLSKHPLTIAELLASRDLDELHLLTDIPVRRLNQFLDGVLPTPTELIDLEDALGVAQEDLMRICGYAEKKADTQEQPNEARNNTP